MIECQLVFVCICVVVVIVLLLFVKETLCLDFNVTSIQT